MMMRIYLNGKFVERSQALISVFDHGLLYGDGVFEGIRSYNGLIFKLQEHIERLFESAHTIMLKIPMSHSELTDVVKQSLRINRLRDAYIRLVVTRGEGDLGLDPRKCVRPTVFVIADKIELYPKQLYERGLELITVATQRNVPEALNPQIKSLNYLNNILAKIEAITAGFEEAILLSHSGYVTECTGENIFTVKGKALLTPPAYIGVLRGITRQTVMGIARRFRLSVQEELLTRHDLFNADEVFLTGTAAEIVPVVKIDGRLIGQGKPGPVTKKLQKAFRELTKTQGVRY
ncbi:MAG: branched-chain-amino-acid transaminase [Candidatus Omnitrophica bacterium]|nr:branched-chain-amino-acid transaminase [Candidatus Omnitrophota bacterium]MBI3010251.1 branched-chain-amino-acid transaminase [Candidatus Omnitrophota bacterium]